MALTLYNTLSKAKEAFTPADPNRVTLYVCGPTVYSYAHIGNARPAVVFDVLYRHLKNHYDNVVYARNITDIDDKINQAAAEAGVPFTQIAEKYTAIYHQDMDALGVLAPDIEPKVTETIPVILSMIERLIESGHAYEAEGHILFHVPSYENYGHLSRRSLEDMVAGARVEVAPYKKHAADFVLWKPSDDETPGWDSPWSRGRPGWHIECSCMIEAHLGETIDIHGGGHDLIFPHHENEIAQSTCAHGGKLYAHTWMHNGFVNIEKEKMSKSIGNVLLVHDLLKEAPGEAIRLALLNAHYRQPLDWTAAGLAQARRTLDGLYGSLRRLKEVQPTPEDIQPTEAFLAALDDDLNTPKAIAELSALSHMANTSEGERELRKTKGALLACGALLGLLNQDPEIWFQGSGESELDTAKIENLLAERQAARKAKDFARADAIRDELDEMGVVIEDSAQGAQWRLKS